MRKQEPHDTAKIFFQSLMQNQCHVCWQLFSDKTQKEFINWTLQDLYQQHPKAAKAAKLGPPEIKLMFETNNLDLILRFWRRFVKQSNAVYFHRYGYFTTAQSNGRQATVAVRLDYENGKEDNVNLTLVNERGSWRLGYLESGLPF
jgi:hypothetical protein